MPALSPQSLGESLGTKLRRLARAADISNPLINPPWLLPAAWAPGTNYVQGDAVANGGSWYVDITAGLSAGSGGPTSVTAATITDNAAVWSYIGGPSISASDALAPTVTTSTAGTPTGLTSHFSLPTFGNCFKVLGGYASVFATNYWHIYSVDQKSGTTVGIGGAVEFETDAPKFAVGFTNGTPPVSIIVNGRRLSPTSYTPASGATPNWIVVDFSSTLGRRKKRVRIEGGKNGFNFAGVRVTSNDTVSKPDTQDDVRAVFISDSMLAGSNYGPFICGGTIPQRVGHLLGWSDCWNMSTGGTGYINPGASSYYTYRQRVAEALTRNPDVWVFVGSTNDTSQTAAAVKAEALATYQAIRAGGSTAPIIVFGLVSINDSNLATTEAAVRDAVTQFGDAKTFFIPIYADPLLPWITGAWNNSALSTSTNSAALIGGDNTHPVDIGTAYLAERKARAIRSTVLPSLA